MVYKKGHDFYLTRKINPKIKLIIAILSVKSNQLNIKKKLNKLLLGANVPVVLLND
jgi:hypothetical protein